MGTPEEAKQKAASTHNTAADLWGFGGSLVLLLALPAAALCQVALGIDGGATILNQSRLSRRLDHGVVGPERPGCLNPSAT